MLGRLCSSTRDNQDGHKASHALSVFNVVYRFWLTLSCRVPCSGYNTCLQKEEAEDVLVPADGCTPDEEGVV